MKMEFSHSISLDKQIGFCSRGQILNLQHPPVMLSDYYRSIQKYSHLTHTTS